MKNIDWHRVHNDQELCSTYAIEVKNRYDLLSQPDDDIEKKYSNLTEANKHVCLSLLPKKQKAEKKLFNDHDLVTNARKNFETAKLKHETRATRRSAKVLADAQKVLDDAYLTAEFRERSILSKTFTPPNNILLLGKLLTRSVAIKIILRSN